ncbi:GSCOCG00001123001-RA-CDS [Cotesia congregata]|nr:GSCOCG00001123001-RA-CDS [Cotesia congregata]
MHCFIIFLLDRRIIIINITANTNVTFDSIISDRQRVSQMRRRYLYRYRLRCSISRRRR